MLRAFAASIASLAVVTGLALAPHSHVHPADAPSAESRHHREGSGVVKHAHLNAHQSAAPDSGSVDLEAGDAPSGHHGPQIISTSDEFVFQIAAGPQSPAPLELAPAAALVPPAVQTAAVPVLQPPAHGPPSGRSGPSRAPPSVPAAAV